jgi:hypothetical protein
MVRLVILAVAISAALIAAPMDCTPGSLADYLLLPADGCRIGPAVVSDFFNAGVLPGSTELSPALISVTPLAGGSAPGFRFAYGAAAGPGEVFQSVVQFLVSMPLTGFGTLQMGNSAVTTGGAAAVTSEFCFGTFIGDGLCDSSTEVLGVFDIGDDSDKFDRRGFPPTAAFAVRLDAVADGGLNSSASLEAAELRFGQVPEPSTATTVCIALAAAGALRYRRRAR